MKVHSSLKCSACRLQSFICCRCKLETKIGPLHAVCPSNSLRVSQGSELSKHLSPVSRKGKAFCKKHCDDAFNGNILTGLHEFLQHCFVKEKGTAS